MDNSATTNKNKNNKNNNEKREVMSDYKSREIKEGDPERAAVTTAGTSSHDTESNKKTGPTIKDISGFDRKVVFINRPGPACKTRRRMAHTPQEEDGSKPSTSGIKRPISPGDTEEKMKRRVINVIDSDDEETEPMSDKSGDEDIPGASPQNTPAPIGTKKRGRGRPATSGQYVGLAKAKAKLLEQEQKELQLLAEKELLEQEATRRETRLLLAQSLKEKRDEQDSDEVEEEQPRRKILLQEAIDSAQSVLDVAKKSANLKGTMVKLLQKAAGNVISASKELASLSAGKEMKALERENRKLKEKITHMEGEVEALKREMAELRLTTHQPRAASPTLDLHESRPSAPSAPAESSDRDSALKLLSERRGNKGLKKEKTNVTSSATPPIFSSPPFVEGQGETMEIVEAGRAIQSLSITERTVKATRTESTMATTTPDMETMMGSIIR